MPPIKTYEDLKIWQQGVALATAIYKISDSGKISNDFGLKDQLRRSAVSISSNIAEGFEYNNSNQFRRYLHYAKGSCAELQTQLLILSNIGFADQKVSRELLNECDVLRKRIGSLLSYLKKSSVIR